MRKNTQLGAHSEGRLVGRSHRCRPGARRGHIHAVRLSAELTLDAEPLRVVILQIQNSIIVVAVSSPG
ncbi:MAG TPA: hypothetical protein VML01_07055 [Bryobacterales bacterium]|nr:hypothetical protein [Bryobacterales bacterium]